MITTALPLQAPPAVNVLPCTEDSAPSDGKDTNSDDGNGFLPTLFTKDKTTATSKSSCESSPPWSQPDSRPMSSLQASLCWIDPLAEEAERRSVQHYDLCYKNERTRGQITFSLRYDYIHRMLMMHLIRAENVQPNDSYRQPNPYVKAYLLPERHHYCRSGIHKKSLNPEFNEVFSFDAPVDSLTSRMLQCTVYDYDRIKRHDIIGNVIMRDLLEKSDLVSWTEFTMQIVDNDVRQACLREKKKDDYGDILLYVKFEPHEQKLIVTVGRAYNLRPMDITGASDPYVKITQLYQHRRIKTKKTSIKRANLHPVYNEVLVFDLPTSAMADTNLLIKVMDWDRIGRDDLLGCCIIGPDSVTREGREQWMNCRYFTDNSSAGSQSGNPGLVNGMWHSLLPDVPLDFRRCVK
ncbi:C2 domain protein [Trichuris suis]|nr:C2 domain protein [Trichuris suis]